MYAVELASRNRQIAWLLRAAGEHHRIKFRKQLFRRDRSGCPVGHSLARALVTDVDAGAKRDAFSGHLLHTPVDLRFLEFEIGNAVAQQPADAVVFLEYDDI